MKKIWNWWWWENWGPHEMTIKGIITVGIVGAVLFISIIAAGVINFISIPECHQAAARQGTTGSYQFPSGCYFRLANGHELPASEYPGKRIYIENYPHMMVPMQERGDRK